MAEFNFSSYIIYLFTGLEIFVTVPEMKIVNGKHCTLCVYIRTCHGNYSLRRYVLLVEPREKY